MGNLGVALVRRTFSYQGDKRSPQRVLILYNHTLQVEVLRKDGKMSHKRNYNLTGENGYTPTIYLH